MSFNYIPTASGMRLHESRKFLKMLVGPYGSGKSCACAIDVLANACAQAPSPSDNVRYSRAGIIRSSFPELISATRKSLLEVLPPECGNIAMSGSPIRGFYFIPLPDGTYVSLELELWALKTPEDCTKLRSANWTFCWINEATGCAAEVYGAATSRIGRFPPQNMGGASWGGTIMDFNMPEPGTWLDTYIKHPEENWDVIQQPPAAFKREENGKVVYDINPDAENLRNLGSPEPDDPPDFTPEQQGMRFYKNQIDANLKLGRTDIVDNQYCMLDVPIVDGKPIFPSFSRERHVSKTEIEPVTGQEVIIGMDQSGLHPAAVFMQHQKNRWCVLDEIYAEGEGFENFLHGMLIPLLRDRYPLCPVTCSIDPSNERDSAMGITPRERLEEAGLKVAPFCTNKPKTRIYAVEQMLNRTVGGLLIDPLCDLLIRGFTHEYRYRRLRASGTGNAAYTPLPEKNDASHIHDALQYAVLYINGKDEGSDIFEKKAQALVGRRKILSRIV